MNEQLTIRKVTRKLIPLLVLLYLVAYIDRSTLGFAKLQMNADVGIGDAAFGLGAGLFFIGYFIFELPSNLILVRVGARRWFARILVTWGAITVAMASIDSVNTFYVLRFLLGAAEAGFYPGVIYYLTQWVPMGHRGRIYGLFLFSQPVAMMITGPLSGAILGMNGLAGLHGWQWLFILTGIPAILLVWPTLRFLPDNPQNATWLTAVEKTWLLNTLAEERKAAGGRQHAKVLATLFDKRVLLLSLYFLPFPLAIYGISLWLPTIIKSFGVDNMTTGLLSAIPFFFGLIGLWVLPRSSDRSQERVGHIALCALLGAAGLAISASSGSPAVQLGALCLTAFGMYAGSAILWTLPGTFLAGASAAAGIAVINSIGNLGGYIGPFAIGALKEATGSIAYGLYFLAGGLILSVVVGIFVRAGLQRDRQQELAAGGLSA